MARLNDRATMDEDSGYCERESQLGRFCAVFVRVWIYRIHRVCHDIEYTVRNSQLQILNHSFHSHYNNRSL